VVCGQIFMQPSPEFVCTAVCRYGESVGDLDVVDGAERSVTCIALDEGCLLVQVCCKCTLFTVRKKAGLSL